MVIRFLIPQLSQPRCIKRVKALQSAGYETVVFGFDNGLYSDNISDLGGEVHRFQMDKGLSRFKSLKRKIFCVKEFCKSLKSDEVVYIFGIELALIYCLFFKPNKVIYEQADLNYTKLSKKWLVSIFKSLDKWLIKKSILTVLTSQGFIDYLFGENNSAENIVLLENKVNSKLYNLAVNDKKVSDKHIKFGFVGLIRYPRTLLTFAQTIGEYFPCHEFHFFGVGESSPQALELCVKYSNLYYHGAFKNPDDLASIYSQIDICVVCYDATSLNVRIAEPNKLYESIFFKTPIIVSDGTFLAKKVEMLGVGYHVDASDKKKIKILVESLTNEDVNKCIRNMEDISKDSLFDNPQIIVDAVKIVNVD